MILPRFLALILACLPLGAAAHEFWLEPLDFQPQNGAPLQAYFKNGENFKGATLSYFERSSTRFELWAKGQMTPLSPRSGDSPALDVAAPLGDGLITVVHETATAQLTYRDWAKFLKFADHKGFTEAPAQHRAAGWPETGFREVYTRHVKALMAVGSGEGKDQEVGLKTEFTALTNPYASDFTGPMQVRLTLDGDPRPEAQVEVFARAPDGTVAVTLHQTDAGGIAAIPVQRGYDYLFDAVVLRKASDRGDQPERPILWQTYWAALTFSVPD